MRRFLAGFLGFAAMPGLALAATGSGAVAESPAEPAGFADLPSLHWAFEAADTLRRLGVAPPDPDGNFRPDAPLTRAVAAVWLVRQTDAALAETATGSFADVPAGGENFAEIETARANGWISGFADGTFRPENPVTRAQFLKILFLANGQKLPDPGGTPEFGDVPTDFWGFPAVRFAARTGLVKGFPGPDGGKIFRPENPVTRAEAAKIMVEFLKNEGIVAPETEAARLAAATAETAESGTTAATPANLESGVFEIFVAGLLDALRAENGGKPALRLDPELSKVARAHAVWLQKNGKKSQHEGENDSDVAARLRLAGVTDWTAAGENVGWAESNARSIVDTLLAIHLDPEGGMMSQPDGEHNHRANILGTFQNWSRVGVGIQIEQTPGTDLKKVWLVEVFAE